MKYDDETLEAVARATGCHRLVIERVVELALAAREFGFTLLVHDQRLHGVAPEENRPLPRDLWLEIDGSFRDLVDLLPTVRRYAAARVIHGYATATVN
jgi:hypothetical protein